MLKLSPIVPVANPGPANGFIATYKAYCNFFACPPKDDFIHFIKVLDESHVTDLDLTLCPGIDSSLKSDLNFNVLPVGHTLLNNSYFRSVVVMNKENKDFIPMCVNHFIEGNKYVTRVICCGTGSEVTSEFGLAWKSNPTNNIQILSLSGNRIGSRASQTFADALQETSRLLQVLDLSSTGLSGSAFYNIVKALCFNWGLSIGIRELNLSENSMNQATSTFFCEDYLGNLNKFGKLTRLSVAGTGLNVTSLVQVLDPLPIQYLDLSDNKIDPKLTSPIVMYLQETSTLSVLRLAGTGLAEEFLMPMVHALLHNPKLKLVHLDISNNPALGKGLDVFTNAFKGSSNLVTLNISDCNLKEKGILALLASIPAHPLRDLNIDKNFSHHDKVISACSAFINSHQDLEYFSLAGGGSKEAGTTLIDFFGCQSGKDRHARKHPTRV
eukprot:TRINITY_DN5554_c0_g1_i1.p1 TRINITY_DN5554_c0_g1~~TRINITY_DN5554_c0_g1_i1.p1  ORF type:complete len:440 (-),score=90.35 TRINITY_DN5554_c0_g1_i1:313-1632(-)